MNKNVIIGVILAIEGFIGTIEFFVLRIDYLIIIGMAALIMAFQMFDIARLEELEQKLFD